MISRAAYTVQIIQTNFIITAYTDWIVLIFFGHYLMSVHWYFLSEQTYCGTCKFSLKKNKTHMHSCIAKSTVTYHQQGRELTVHCLHWRTKQVLCWQNQRRKQILCPSHTSKPGDKWNVKERSIKTANRKLIIDLAVCSSNTNRKITLNVAMLWFKCSFGAKYLKLVKFLFSFVM